jgi:glycine/D-amino acid oxidase-like deaminating enzyme
MRVNTNTVENPADAVRNPHPNWRRRRGSAYIGATVVTLERRSPAPRLAAAGGSFWFTTGDPGPASGPATGHRRVDIAIVGGGFTGLWTALALLETDPSLRVAVLEAERVGWGASGRNGGFCEASLTHGLSNGLLHYPEEIDILETEGKRNLAELVAFVREEGIDAELEATGTLSVATRPHEVAELGAYVELGERHGSGLRFLDRDAIRAEVHSPRWLAGVRAGPEHCVMVNPAKLAWGLAEAARRRGAAVHEQSRVTGIRRRAGGVTLDIAGGGRVEAAHALVATSAYSGWMRRLVPLFVPIYDYVLMTEPLSPAQLESIGWCGREGMSDAGNQFHYFRLSADNRILWGGYDAIYHRGNRVVPEHDQRPATFERLAAHFGAAFPQLSGIRFTHRWGGAIDTTTRFTVTFGEALGGRVHYALGYTGLGVGASRWGGGILRDLVLRPDSPLLDLRFVRSTPLPIPPEPVRTPTVEIMRRAVIGADDHAGRRGWFLRAMDALGIGFDS